MEYSAENVLCPFYEGETRNSIKCEGIISVTCSNNFSTIKTKKKHYELKCCDNYRRCEVYRALEQKY